MTKRTHISQRAAMRMALKCDPPIGITGERVRLSAEMSKPVAKRRTFKRRKAN